MSPPRQLPWLFPPLTSPLPPLTGISWFGLERDEEMYNGLNVRPMGEILDFIAEHFNVLRLPFSVDIALKGPDHMPPQWAVGPGLYGKKTWDIVDEIIDQVQRREEKRRGWL